MTVTSLRGQEMLSYLPLHARRSKFLRDTFQAEGVEFDKLRYALDGVLDQFFVRTATWGLDSWEQELGLETIETDSFDVRRSRILAKLRSSSSFSARTLEGVASAYTGRPVKVTVDALTYTITFEFETAFITASSFYKQIETIIHAHMSPRYRAVFTYTQELRVQFDFKRYMYPFPITGTFLCGTWPDASTWGRLYRDDVELKQSDYYTGQWPYKYAGKVQTGSNREIETLYLQSSSDLELNQQQRKSIRPYNLCGNFHSGLGGTI
ncbi:putative phage tail protein [Paenibacillus sp. NPDC057967]|uniref:putative phage tail protein n=1 Tax=Paenibacillus sp. NPDC057967 TaxID=3346293 RepID=UPI0036DE2954